MVTGTTKTKLIKEEELYVSYLSQPESWRYDTAIINPADIHTLQNNLTTAELVTVNSDSKDIDISTSNITEAADGTDTYEWYGYISKPGVDTIVSGGFVTNLDGVLQTNEDVLDIGGLITDGVVNAGNINDYLRFHGSTLQIDRDGGGNSFTNLVNIVGTNITNAHLDELYTAGQILA